jgi:predicted nucleic acid-binding protein
VTSITIDTNVLVSFLTDRNPDQRATAERWLAAAANGEVEILLPQLMVAELIFVLSRTYGLTMDRVATIIQNLLALPGVVVVDSFAWSILLRIWPSSLSSFADAVFASVAVERKTSALTFDERLRRELLRLQVGLAND